MRSRHVASLLIALLIPVFACAQEDDDKVMGNYHGAFTGGAASGFIRAEVVALGEKPYRAVFYSGPSEAEAQRVEIKGAREQKGAPVLLEGEVELGGKSCAITATIEAEKMTGTITCGDTASPFALERVFLKSPTLGMAPPEGATVLLNEQGNQFVRTPEDWCLEPDGWWKVCDSNWITTQEFGPALYHIEFMTPFMPAHRDQGRGNSGVYIMGRYEVQVLDSFGDLPADNLCGGIYKKAVPTSMAAYPPLQPQTYDITFYPPEYDQSGRKTRDAIINVVLNGITIHDNVVLPSVTPGGISGEEAATGPLMLQDHNDRVSYRNIWVQPLNK